MIPFRIIGLTVLLLIASCSLRQSSDKDTITVSILPYKYLAERIAGDRFEVNVLTPPGSNHETFEPTPRQLSILNNSKMLMINGYLLFEDNLVKKNLQNFKLSLIDLSRDTELIAGETIDHGDHVHLNGIDPHFWLSPGEVRRQIKVMLDAFCEKDPEGKETYETNYHNLLSDIDSLDRYMKQAFSQLRTRSFLIYHPALTYLARDYGLNQVAIEMEGKEPTMQHMHRIVEFAKTQGIKTVFIQRQFNSESATSIAREIGGHVEILDPLAADWLANMYAITATLRKAML